MSYRRRNRARQRRTRERAREALAKKAVAMLAEWTFDGDRWYIDPHAPMAPGEVQAATFAHALMMRVEPEPLCFDAAPES